LPVHKSYFGKVEYLNRRAQDSVLHNLMLKNSHFEQPYNHCPFLCSAFVHNTMKIQP